jgi:hypothetical protein
MSATVHTPPLRWARVHRAALVIVVLSMALAAALGLFAARLVADAGRAPTTSVSDVQLRPTDNGCQLDRPGVGGVTRPC